MELDELLKSLDIQSLNVCCAGNLIEVARGTKHIAKRLGRINQVTAHIFPNGKIGGSHYHHTKKEYFAVCGGTIDLYFGMQEIYKKTIPSGSSFFIDSSIAHALHNPYMENAFLVELSNVEFDPSNLHNPKKDVYSFPIIDKDTQKLLRKIHNL